MRRVVVNEWMSLDGVVQAPGNLEEDTTGGFQHGGWHMRYFDDMARKWVVDHLTEAGAFLLGRRTYEILAAYWPHAPEEEHVVAEPLNSKRKYVASTTLSDPLEWEHSSVRERSRMSPGPGLRRPRRPVGGPNSTDTRSRTAPLVPV